MNRIEGQIQREQYLGQPIEMFRGIFPYATNDPGFKAGKEMGIELPLKVELAIHPNKSGRIMINIPGIGGTMDGYSGKYKKIATEVQRHNLAAVIRVHNYEYQGYLGDVQLRSALKYARENARAICGEENPEVFLSGYSAGASAIGAIAHEYPEVTRILLLAPAGNMPEHMLKDGLTKYRGEVVILQGENDKMVGRDAGAKYLQYLTNVSHSEIFMLPGCDHQFRGEPFGRIMSEAPFYAFARSRFERPKFPDPVGGIKLYD